MLYDATLAIDSGGTIEADYFINGTSSMNVQVCFPAGTPVVMADGTTRTIENILSGDEVKAVAHQNPNGEIVTGRVVRVFQNTPQMLCHLHFGTFEIWATHEHPFYVKDRGWVAAEDLKVGDVCRSASGNDVVLLYIDYESEEVPVFNFEVEGCHTYFVGSSVTKSVLVHNTCPYCLSNDCDGYSSSPVSWSMWRSLYTGNGFSCDNLYYGTTYQTSAGLKAGAVEVAYKVSLPIAWATWNSEFEALGNARSTAWTESGLDDTWTKFATQTSANISAGATYALLFRGPIIRSIGNKTVSAEEWAALTNGKNFANLSAYEKGIILINEKGFLSALCPTRQGLMLGTTTKYSTILGHLPSYETIVIGVPTGSATTYGWKTLITNINSSNQ